MEGINIFSNTRTHFGGSAGRPPVAASNPTGDGECERTQGSRPHRAAQARDAYERLRPPAAVFKRKTRARRMLQVAFPARPRLVRKGGFRP